MPTQGRQRLYSRSVFTMHPRLTTDSFTLYIKASALLGKVKAFNGRFRYRYTDGDGTGRPILGSDSTSPYTTPSDPSEPNPYGRPVNEVTMIEPQKTAEFQALDDLIRAFSASIPREFKDPVGMDSGARLDPTLYMAHMLPHV